MRHPVHATAEEIYQAVNRTDPRASRATVYNNLHALMKAGLVCELPVEGNAIRFDANVKRHHHFVCKCCGRIEDIDWFDVPHLARRSALGKRTVGDYQLVIRGTCEDCSQPLEEETTCLN